MSIKWTLACLALAVAGATCGCLGSPPLPANADAGYGPGPDLAPTCVGNNDGVIDRGELAFPLGAMVRYLANPTNTTVTVDPQGKLTPSGPEWDLTSTAGDVLSLAIEPVAGQWFAASFPGATYATVSDRATDTLGVFRVTNDGLLILGFASRAPNQTLLVYDQPVLSLKFPVTPGDAWVTGAKVVGGTLNGQPFAESDTYRISIDARGKAVLPFLSFDNTLRVHVELSQAIPGGVAITRIQYLFFHECFGEVGRMVSNPGETNTAFTTAAEFRRLAL